MREDTKANNIALIREMLKTNHPTAWKDHVQLRLWEHGYLIGLLSSLMEETYVVKQAVKSRIKNVN